MLIITNHFCDKTHKFVTFAPLFKKINMEAWELDFEWLKIRHIVKDAMKKEHLPDFQTILSLVGVQESGRWKKENFTKEEIDMQTLVIIGNSQTYVENGRMITPRGYKL